MVKRKMNRNDNINSINININKLLRKNENYINLFDNKRIEKIEKQNNIFKKSKKNFSFNNYLNNEDITINNNFNNNLTQNDINSFYINENYENNEKSKNKSKTKYNIYSYFQLSDKDKIFNSNKSDISAYSSNKNNLENQYTKKTENTNAVTNRKSRSISLTPNGFYRVNNTESSDLKNNRTDFIDTSNNFNNFDYNEEEKTNKKSTIVKALSTNNIYNNMTQTRFYRVKIDPEQLASNYAKEKVKSINSARNLNYDLNTYKNSNHKFSYSENCKINQSFSGIESKSQKVNVYNEYMTNYNLNSNLNDKIKNEILFNSNINNNIQRNNLKNNKNNKKLNSYRTSCALRKGNSYCNLKKIIGENKKIEKNSNSKIMKFLKNYNTNTNIENNLFDKKTYKISSPLTEINNKNNSLKSFNTSNNNYGNGYNKFLRKKIFNENEKKKNNILSPEKEKKNISEKNNIYRNNRMNLCSNCEKLFQLSQIN